MTERSPFEGHSATSAVPVTRLSTSYRFDSEMAQLLTDFQYSADGITLGAAHDTRSLDAEASVAPTAGLDAVLGSDASLVFVRYADRGHRMANPIEATITTAIADALPDASDGPSLGVVTPHNAQRGTLAAELPSAVTVNTVEQYQGDQRDVIVVSATVSDPAFARRENRFILDPRRLLVAISRSKLRSVVICSDALLELIPHDPDRLDNGPVWARLFALTAGRDADPEWAGSLDEFTASSVDHPAVPLEVYR